MLGGIGKYDKFSIAMAHTPCMIWKHISYGWYIETNP